MSAQLTGPALAADELSTPTVNGDVTLDADGPSTPPLPSQLLGANIALLVGAIAAHLPQELAPQSRYQVAVDLAKTVIGSPVAQALQP
jgi:hypothetical protein